MYYMICLHLAIHIFPLILLISPVSPKIAIFPNGNGHLAEAPKGSGKTDARFKKKNLGADGWE